MEYRFYNPGQAIEDSIPFSLSTSAEDQTTGRHIIKAPAEGFFHLSTELDLPNGTTLRVEFPTDFHLKYRDRGVIWILPEKEARRLFGEGGIPEDKPFALNDEDAKRKGDELWYQYTRMIAERHVQEAANARASGGAPRKAMGFTAYCLKKHNIVDPSDEIFARALDQKAADEKVSRLEVQFGQMAQQNQMLMSLLMAKLGVSAADLAALQAAAAPAEQVPATVPSTSLPEPVSTPARGPAPTSTKGKGAKK